MLDALGHDAAKLAQDECAGMPVQCPDRGDGTGGRPAPRQPAAHAPRLPPAERPSNPSSRSFHGTSTAWTFAACPSPDPRAPQHRRDAADLPRVDRRHRRPFRQSDPGTDWRTWAIDFGFAEFENAVLKQDLRVSAGGAKDYVEKALKLPGTPPFNAHPLYRYMTRFDEMMHPGPTPRSGPSGRSTSWRRTGKR